MIDCGSLTTPANGGQTATGSYLGNTATFDCAYGYRRTGTAVRTCQAARTWSGTPTGCVCKLFPNIIILLEKVIAK